MKFDMDINDFHKKLSELFTVFNETIKPLIADIETKYQQCEPSILNEIRSFTDNIARCYRKDVIDKLLINRKLLINIKKPILFSLNCI